MIARIPDSVVSVAWLVENRAAENLVVFDARMKPIFPAEGAGKTEPIYVPGALRFDFDDVLCDHTTGLPHMMPSPQLFTDEMRKMGVDDDSAIVAYDEVGIYSSPRAWWMLRAMGHDQVAVLDGGLPAWIAGGNATSSTLAAPPERPGTFTARPRRHLFVDSQAVLHALADDAFRVIDARSAGRFNGRDPEPRPGLRRGHMPNAINLPYPQVLDGNVLSGRPQLEQLFQPYRGKKLIFSCGSGVTACIDALAAYQAGFKELTVYDGSWTEWGDPRSGLPVATEP